MRGVFMKSVKSRLFKILLAAFALVLFGAQVFAADVVLTPFGQSPDAMMIKVVLKKLKVDGRLEKLLSANDLKEEKVLITVVGGSSKGLGAAGIDKDVEMERVKKLVKEAKKKGMKVLVMHIGGKGRRGKLTDMFISEAAPLADKLIVVNGGNHDGLFSKAVKGKKIEIMSAPSVRGTGKPLDKVLSEWGVL
eukprot:Anaeramoba_flamelloidesa1071473_12.p1 GENE.a1071473_12~~a1071473_12.p1  ORF type:complete len:192 (-),score=23.26 a1071473_12:56-631(-)